MVTNPLPFFLWNGGVHSSLLNWDRPCFDQWNVVNVMLGNF